MTKAKPDSNLFENPREVPAGVPLAERLRAENLDQVLGQPKLTGKEGLLRRLLEEGRMESLIFWGPPGCGKTTLARMLIRESGLHHESLNAVTSGVADLRRVIAEAEARRQYGERSLLFIDEIHRYNKAQQDALLKCVEDGTITLIAATTENPGFEIIRPLLSRCHVLPFEALDDEALSLLLERALSEDAWLLSLSLEIEPVAKKALIFIAGGDARRLLQILELAVGTARTASNGKRHLKRSHIDAISKSQLLPFDKGGDQHYDIASALIKSVRGSDADAAIYWLARLLEGGEQPTFIARRLLILASEDIGNAAPNGLVLANACFDAVHKLGMPEAMYPLAQCTAYLAAQPKSNRCAEAILKAKKVVRKSVVPSVPMHLRNAPTHLAKEMGHGVGYAYPPDSEGSFVDQSYFPEGMEPQCFYRPSALGFEGRMQAYLHGCWPDRYGDEDES
jgi:putative ATPase